VRFPVAVPGLPGVALPVPWSPGNVLPVNKTELDIVPS
jgi:hypothetical protein